ncbi:MAG TPA: arsenate reductase ArsC [Ktedonobacterales bacterium]|nr:arsenate reductase ArsC [Ktedonobacterales bacterium]
MKQRVLILCTGNSARSQIAEGWLRHLAGERFDVFSAGTKPSVVNPLAIQVMHEVDIDISDHSSKSVTEFVDQPFDYVITVCDQAAEACPVFPGPAQRLHWSFPDPAAVRGDESMRLQAFREVRDGLKDRLTGWIASL